MSISIGNNTALSDVFSSVNTQTTLVLKSSLPSPALAVTNTSNFATLQVQANAASFLFGAVGSNFVLSNVLTRQTPLLIGPAAGIVASLPATFASNVLMQQALSVASIATAGVSLSNATFQTSSASSAGGCNVLDMSIDGSTVFRISNRRVLSHLGSVGIGTTAPAQELHVASNAQIDRRLYCSNLLTNVLSEPGGSNPVFLRSNGVRVAGNLTVEGLLEATGAISFATSVIIDTLSVTRQFTAATALVSNSNAAGAPSLGISHAVPGYRAAGGGWAYCNVLPIVDASVALPDGSNYRALRIDQYGRAALGDRAPSHMLNIDMSSDYTCNVAQGLLCAQNTASQVFAVDGRAHVGIGTSLPAFQLHLCAAAGAAPGTAIGLQDAAGALAFAVDAGGATGIGPGASNPGWAPAEARPGLALSVAGPAAVRDTLWLSNVQGLQNNTVGMSNVSLLGLAHLGSSNAAIGRLDVGRVLAGELVASSVAVEGLSVNALASNITTSLDIFAFTGTRMLLSAGDHALARLQAVAATEGTLKVVAPADPAYAVQRAVGLYGESPSLYMKIDANQAYPLPASANIELEQSDGNLGVVRMNNNGSTPTLSLLVNKNGTEFAMMDMVVDAANKRAVRVMANALAVDDGQVAVARNLSVGGQMTVASNVLVGGTLSAQNTILTTSDRRLKTDLVPIADALSKVLRLTGYTFRRTDLPGRAPDTGLVAQEVQAVLPEAVGADCTDHLAVAYGNLAGLFVEAFKEVDAKCAALAARCEALEAAALEASHAQYL